MEYIKQTFQKFGVQDNAKVMYRFLLISFSFTYLLLMCFSFLIDTGISIAATPYLLTLPLFYYLVLLILFSFVFPVFAIKRTINLVVIPKILIDILIIADFFVFRIYRFHIDSMFINMLVYDFKGIGVSGALLAFSALVILAVIALNIAIFKLCISHIAIKVKRVNISIVLVCLLAQLSHVVAYEYKFVPITKLTPYWPYYKPLTSRSLMASLQKQFPHTFPKRELTEQDSAQSLLTKSTSKGLLAYPKNELRLSENRQRPNVLIFIFESWRQDSLSYDITPNIAQFSEQATVFNQHYSGGSVTVNGLYSLMYGLHPTYRNYMESDPYNNQTLFTKTLSELGYDISVYTSSNLHRFSLKELFFGRVESDKYHNPMGEPMEINDAKAVNLLIEDLKKPSEKPWFKFVFLSSSHHHYDYPAEFAKFQPIEKNPEAFVFNKYMDGAGFFNDFKNSMYYLDDLFGQVREVMNQHGMDNNTVTLVTSDHGEEFNDNQAGYWGHGSNFTDYQIAVPFVLKMPNQIEGNRVSDLTSHIDFVPTMLRYLGVDNPLSDYSNGVDLFNLPNKRPGLIFASYKSTAYLIDEYIYSAGLTVQSYHRRNVKQENPEFDYQRLIKLKNEESQLLKQ